LTADLQALLEKHLPVIRRGVKRGKASADYTPGLGQELGWIAGGGDIDPAASRPAITLTAQPGKVRVDGQKPGFEAVNLYSRRKGEAEWKLAAIRKRKFPIYDDAPLWPWRGRPRSANTGPSAS
jgi:hypothetical protein